MPKFMRPETALARLVEDQDAPIMARCEALKQLAHPPRCLLRRLLVNTDKRPKPVPAKLKAIATLAYVRETQLRKLRKIANGGRKAAQDSQPNALGI